MYEIGDPTSYMLPDVTLDMTNVSLTEKQDDFVKNKTSSVLIKLQYVLCNCLEKFSSGCYWSKW